VWAAYFDIIALLVLSLRAIKDDWRESVDDALKKAESWPTD